MKINPKDYEVVIEGEITPEMAGVVLADVARWLEETGMAVVMIEEQPAVVEEEEAVEA